MENRELLVYAVFLQNRSISGHSKRRRATTNMACYWLAADLRKNIFVVLRQLGCRLEKGASNLNSSAFLICVVGHTSHGRFSRILRLDCFADPLARIEWGSAGFGSPATTC